MANESVVPAPRPPSGSPVKRGRDSTLFALLSFEGPDVYSQAGGLGVREKELSRVLAAQGHETHLFFYGDPDLPAEERQVEGRLHLHRWGQWLSRIHPAGVYDGEEAKVREWNRSLPRNLVESVLAPAAERGQRLVVLAEEWQTAASVLTLDGMLAARGLRDRSVILWNANNLYGFERIDWTALRSASTLTTVSRYMKQRMLALPLDPPVNAIVIPNGVPKEAIVDAPAADRKAVREASGADLFCVKIGRFDPDKHWLMAMTAMGALKREAMRVRMLIRGGREPHGREVLAHAAASGLRVADVASPPDVAGLVRLLRQQTEAEVLNLVTFLPESLLGTIYAAADAVLANSRHEPFGLVGLEVMAAGGVAVTGSTGEDYALPFHNALVMESADPVELVAGLRLLHEQPHVGRRLRREGRRTAREFVWEDVLEQLFFRLELAALQQGVTRRAPGG